MTVCGQYSTGRMCVCGLGRGWQQDQAELDHWQRWRRSGLLLSRPWPQARQDGCLLWK